MILREYGAIIFIDIEENVYFLNHDKWAKNYVFYRAGQYTAYRADGDGN